MKRIEAIKLWLPHVGIAQHQATRLIKLSEVAEKDQTDWHNGDCKEAKAEKSCNAFESYAGKLGFDVMWPGIFPVLQRDGRDIYLPDYDIEGTKLTESQHLKRFSFSVLHMLSATYYHKVGSDGVWFHGDTIDTGSELFDHRIDVITDIVDNFLRLVPGLQETDYYADYSLIIDMDELEAEGWDESNLAVFIETIADWLQEGKPLRSECAPWRYESTDAWGTKIYIRRFADFIVPNHPNFEGWDFADQSSRLRTGNGVGSRQYELPPEVSYDQDQ